MPTWREATIYESFIDQLSSPSVSIYLPTLTLRNHPARSVKWSENFVIKVNILQLDALLRNNTVKCQQQQKSSVFCRRTIIQDYILLIRSFHLKCPCSIPFSFLEHGPKITPSHSQSWNDNFKQMYPENTPKNLRPETQFQALLCLKKMSADSIWKRKVSNKLLIKDMY